MCMENSKIKVLDETVAGLGKASKLGSLRHFYNSTWTKTPLG